MKKSQLPTCRQGEESKAREALFQYLDFERALQLASCVRCGLCAQTCHYFLTDRDVKSVPAYKVGLVQRVFLYYFGYKQKIFQRWLGYQKFDRSTLQEWVDILFGRCSLCGRCSLNCPLGLKIHDLIRFGRGILAALDMVPSGLASTIRTAINFDNNMGIKTEEWVETVKWLSEELQAELGLVSFSLPLDQAGAKILYAINPREAKFFPLSLLAVAKIFYAAQESWTLSSVGYDLTNYAYYLGDDKIATLFFKRLEASMKRLGCQCLVLSECGHGFLSARWEAPGWLKYRPDFEIKSILEIVSEYVREGKIKLDPSRNKLPVTLHDPCNLVRLGGLLEEGRFLLRQAAVHFVEMKPHGLENYCCGGGGGQLAMTEFAPRRLKAGKLKADQIKHTGAKIVVAPCHNCLDQLLELNRFYKLGIQAKTLCEVVAEALVLN